MSEPRETPETPPDAPPEALPEVTIRRRHWGFSVIWIVPLVAALVAGYLVYQRVQERGPTITIAFEDGTGVKAGQTEIRYRGVPIGEVEAIDVSRDAEHVVITARLRRSAARLAVEGTEFWIVRPELGPARITGLTTVLTGPYIQLLPGKGKSKTSFAGLEKPPPAPERNGLKIILAAGQLGSLRPGSPVYYRGIEVGSVTDFALSRDATAAHVEVYILHSYARLVRIGSRFWSTSGLDVDVSLRKGIEISMESLRSLLVGGIAFATPDGASSPARNGTIFVLHDKAEAEWLAWTPKIALPAAASD
jgi:paraquat-inducible protein B